MLLAEYVFSWNASRFTEQRAPKEGASGIHPSYRLAPGPLTVVGGSGTLAGNHQLGQHIWVASHRQRRHVKPDLASFEIGDYRTNPAVVVVS
jgi:hypothetical protein